MSWREDLNPFTDPRGTPILPYQGMYGTLVHDPQQNHGYVPIASPHTLTGGITPMIRPVSTLAGYHHTAMPVGATFPPPPYMSQNAVSSSLMGVLMGSNPAVLGPGSLYMTQPSIGIPDIHPSGSGLNVLSPPIMDVYSNPNPVIATGQHMVPQPFDQGVSKLFIPPPPPLKQAPGLSRNTATPAKKQTSSKPDKCTVGAVDNHTHTNNTTQSEVGLSERELAETVRVQSQLWMPPKVASFPDRDDRIRVSGPAMSADQSLHSEIAPGESSSKSATSSTSTPTTTAVSSSQMPHWFGISSSSTGTPESRQQLSPAEDPLTPSSFSAFKIKNELLSERENTSFVDDHLDYRVVAGNYKCNHCNYISPRTDKMLQHIGAHERGHVCTICNKAFTKQCDLARHGKSHTKGAPKNNDPTFGNETVPRPEVKQSSNIDANEQSPSAATSERSNDDDATQYALNSQTPDASSNISHVEPDRDSVDSGLTVSVIKQNEAVQQNSKTTDEPDNIESKTLQSETENENDVITIRDETDDDVLCVITQNETQSSIEEASQSTSQKRNRLSCDSQDSNLKIEDVRSCADSSSQLDLASPGLGSQTETTSPCQSPFEGQPASTIVPLPEYTPVEGNVIDLANNNLPAEPNVDGSESDNLQSDLNDSTTQFPRLPNQCMSDFRCSLCNYEGRSAKSLQKHLRAHNQSYKICRYCNKAFERPSDLARHEERHETNMVRHGGDPCIMSKGQVLGISGTNPPTVVEPPKVQTFRCKKCGFVTNRYHKLALHNRQKHSTKHPCPLCGMTFISKLPLGNHMKRCSAKSVAAAASVSKEVIPETLKEISDVPTPPMPLLTKHVQPTPVVTQEYVDNPTLVDILRNKLSVSCSQNPVSEPNMPIPTIAPSCMSAPKPPTGTKGIGRLDFYSKDVLQNTKLLNVSVGSNNDIVIRSDDVREEDDGYSTSRIPCCSQYADARIILQKGHQRMVAENYPPPSRIAASATIVSVDNQKLLPTVVQETFFTPSANDLPVGLPPPPALKPSVPPSNIPPRSVVQMSPNPIENIMSTVNNSRFIIDKMLPVGTNVARGTAKPTISKEDVPSVVIKITDAVKVSQPKPSTSSDSGMGSTFEVKSTQLLKICQSPGKKIVTTPKPSEYLKPKPNNAMPVLSINPNILKKKTLDKSAKKGGSSSQIMRPNVYRHKRTAYYCERCNYGTDAKSKMDEHLRAHGGRFVCKHCNKACIKASDLYRHWVTHNLRDENGNLICDTCEFTSPSKNILADHLRIHYLMRLNPLGPSHNITKCGICGKKFTRSQLFVHKRVVHGNQRRNQTSAAASVRAARGWTSRGKGALPGAANQLDAGIDYWCPVCNEHFDNAQSMTIHYDMKHLTDNNNAIDGTVTVSEDFFSGPPEKSNPSTQGPVTCTYCGRGFNSRRQLIGHERIHYTSRRGRGQGPKSPSRRRAHRPRKYKCPHCQKRFRSQYYLTQHERLHTGEKPYECSKCGRRFALHQACLQHERRNCPGERERTYVKIEAGSSIVTSSWETNPDVANTSQPRSKVNVERTDANKSGIEDVEDDILRRTLPLPSIEIVTD